LGDVGIPGQDNKSEKLIHDRLEGGRFTLFDVGAKGGTHELPNLAAWVNVFGFEPNPTEYAKLKKISSSKGDVGRYARAEYFPLALSEKSGEATLNISKHPSYSSLLDTDKESFQRHFGFMPRFPEWISNLQHQDKISVKTAALDDITEQLQVDHIDYIKMDTQGTELKILNGADRLLKSGAISVIKCEVGFIPVYKNQCLFSDVDRLLRSHDFQFVDCIFDRDVIYESRRSNDTEHLPLRNISDIPRYASGGDAIFIYDHTLKGELDIKRSFKMGLILAEMRYFSLAYNCLKRTDLSAEEIRSLILFAATRTINEKLRDIAKKWLPPGLVAYLKK